MTIAVCEGLLDAGLDNTEEVQKRLLIHSLKKWGARFSWWLEQKQPNPYNSFGNGSAMRVSSVAWLYNSLDRVRQAARHTAEITHNHPEAITAFLEGKDFEDVIRTAVSLGGDCDTMTAIAGSIAEGFYGVPECLKMECRKRLPEDMLQIFDIFELARENALC